VLAEELRRVSAAHVAMTEEAKTLRRRTRVKSPKFL
jgi:hypothetical protein